MYSIEIIKLFLYHYSQKNKTINEISDLLMVSKRKVHRWISKYCKEKIKDIHLDEDLNNNKRIHGSKRIHIYYSKIKKYVEDNKGCTLTNIKDYINNELSNSSICRILKFLGITRKRIKNNMVCKELKDILVDRKNFSKKVFNEKNFLNKTICIDETAFSINDHSLYGYSKKGTEIRKFYKHKRIGERYSLLCAIDKDTIIDTYLALGGIKSDMYLNFLEKNKDIFKGKIILQDNAKIHDSKIVKDYALGESIEMQYIPPYSPEFNPIELIFSKMKIKYRSLDHKNVLKDIEESKNYINGENLKKVIYMP